MMLGLLNPAFVASLGSTLTPAQALVRDSFTDTDDTDLSAHTPEVGAAWQKLTSGTGTILIESNRAINPQNGADAAWINLAVPNSADYDVSTDVIFASPNGGNIGIIGRAVPGQNKYFWALWENDGHWSLYARDGGSITALQRTSASVTSGQTYRLTLSMRGTDIKLLVDGAETASGTSSLITDAGACGVTFYNDTIGSLDNFLATNYVPPPVAQTVAPTDSRVYYSPYNWLAGSGVMSSNTPGAYLKTRFSGTQFGLVLDTSANSGAFYRLEYSIDDGALQSLTLAAAEIATHMLTTGLSAGTHTAQVYLAALAISDRWTGPADAWRVGGIVIDATGSLSAPTIRPKRMIVYGDSITEGASALGAADTVANAKWTVTWDRLLADALDAEIGAIGYQAQGYEQGGQGNVPAVPTAWDHLDSTHSRSFAAHPDYVFVLHGTNGTTTQSDVQALLTDLRGVFPSAPIYQIVPFGQYAKVAITAAVAAQGDADAHLIDLGTTGQGYVASPYSYDGTHPNTAGHAALAPLIQAAL